MTIKTQVQAASGANFFLGIWLIIAPFALAYTQSASARWNDVIVGAAITIMAGRCVVASADAVGLSCACAVLGGWLVIAPFVLGNRRHRGQCVQRRGGRPHRGCSWRLERLRRTAITRWR